MLPNTLAHEHVGSRTRWLTNTLAQDRARGPLCLKFYNTFLVSFMRNHGLLLPPLFVVLCCCTPLCNKNLTMWKLGKHCIFHCRRPCPITPTYCD